MRTDQITITVPKSKKGLREKLQRMKEDESINISAFIVRAIEEKLSRVSDQYYVDGWIIEE
jgi:hypothetical protein|tara:strand:+ start:163 stop:345 length:183 start_codon:yes stop_codon:yes gene_type:complete